ncbi:AGAP007469-PA-like protein [Anopheles sinensis]|uniref:AGAP007469-PA-like protein n=1 Tax=Anopheles sinensis TaxID=74873 RepID=A0A084WLG0_ANOSI|nr:AGAP007469-PA-like protein [Anopheles sinensis]
MDSCVDGGVCTIPRLDTTQNGWARSIVSAIQQEHSMVIIQSVTLPVSPGAMASFVQIMSSFTAELTFRKYYERVFYSPRDTEVETLLLIDAPVLQEFRIQPNRHIRSLSIYNTGLRQFPQGLKYLASLNTLYASKNQFTQFTLASFSSTQRFSRMDLSDNQISLLIGTNHTVSIETLNIALNRLTTVDMAFFGQIANLSVLHLIYNQIIRVDSTMPVKLLALDQLMLTNYRLTSFQPQAVTFPVLRTLSLRSNNLSSVPRNLANYPALESLDLGENKLTRVDLSSIRQAKKLASLNLDRNMIASLSASSPLQHDALRVVSVNSNELVQVNFTGCIFPSLQSITMGCNRLTSVPSNVFQLFPAVMLYMPGNPTSCESAKKFKKQLLNRTLTLNTVGRGASCREHESLIEIDSWSNVCCAK